jgi:hypothetical protein
MTPVAGVVRPDTELLFGYSTRSKRKPVASIVRGITETGYRVPEVGTVIGG